MDEIQQVETDAGVWYVYDTCRTIPGYGNLWVRGVVSQAEADAGLHAVVRLALILLPFFVLLVALGGYSITRRTLGPLQDVTDTAQRISQGSDLTQRIRMGPGEDEVHRLAHTFDRMMDKLQSAFESEKQFTSDVSHELRTPVSVILSQCEFALSEDAEDAERRSALQVVAAQARKMSTLIAQLLTLARTDSGRQSLHMETLNLSELAEIICEEQADAAAARNIALHAEIAPNVLLRADETMMMRLFMNLVQNAISYGREGGNIWVTLRDAEGAVEGCVRDDGIGIAAEHLSKIWNRFYQVDPSRTASRSGAGRGCPWSAGSSRRTAARSPSTARPARVLPLHSPFPNDARPGQTSRPHFFHRMQISLAQFCTPLICRRTQISPAWNASSGSVSSSSRCVTSTDWTTSPCTSHSTREVPSGADPQVTCAWSCCADGSERASFSPATNPSLARANSSRQTPPRTVLRSIWMTPRFHTCSGEVTSVLTLVPAATLRCPRPRQASSSAKHTQPAMSSFP